MLVEDGNRPEMGSPLGSGVNIEYVTAVENNAVNGANWLSDRKTKLRASTPLPLQLLVAGLYGTVGVLAMTVYTESTAVTARRPTVL